VIARAHGYCVRRRAGVSGATNPPRVTGVIPSALAAALPCVYKPPMPRAVHNIRRCQFRFEQTVFDKLKRAAKRRDITLTKMVTQLIECQDVVDLQRDKHPRESKKQ
jgi:hypothetical protein